MEFEGESQLDGDGVADLTIAPIDPRVGLDPGDLAPPDAPIDQENGPRYLSPSSADAYRQCPKRWQYRYIERLPDPPGEAALAGTFAHRVLELLLQEDPADRTIERAKALARVAWPEIEADPDYQALGHDDATGRAFRWRGWVAIEGLWLLEDPRQVTVAATEHQVLTQVASVPFRGIVDRLDRTSDGGLAVSDYKSGRAPSPRYTESRLTQVLLYAAAVEASFGERPSHVRLLYLGQKVIERRVDDESLMRVTADLEDTWTSLTTDVRANHFEARTGPLCAWCPYASACPEGQAEIQRRSDYGTLDPNAPNAHLATKVA